MSSEVAMAVHEVKIPQLGVNDEFAILVRWYVEDGALVERDAPLCCIETSKATEDLAADHEGYVRIEVEAGATVKIQETIAYIVSSLDTDLEPYRKAAAAESAARPQAPVATAARAPAGTRATKRAQALAQARGLDLALVPARGIVKEADVEAYLAARSSLPRPAAGPRTKVAIYGAGLGGLTVRECLELGGHYSVAYFLDDDPTLGDRINGIPLMAGRDLEALPQKGVRHVALAIASARVRLELRDKVVALGLQLINAVHPPTYISPSATLGLGNHVKAGAVIDTGTRIGDCCIIDNGVTIAHDNAIEDGCHLAPGVSMGSSVFVGRAAIIGIGASISTKVRIGRSVIVGVGSAVVCDVPDNSVVEGVPARVVGQSKLGT